MSDLAASVEMNAIAFAERLMADRSLLACLDAAVKDEYVTEVVERLKLEADRYWAIDPNRSVDLADIIIAIGTQCGQLAIVALGTMARGDALKLIGRATEAWDTLGQAGLLYQQANDEVGWARTRIGRLVLGPMLNRVPEALTDADQARAIFTVHGERERLLRLDWQTASVYHYLGDPHKALELFASALLGAEVLLETGQPYFGPLYANMGTAYEDLGDLQRALDYFERARAIFSRNGEILNLITVESNTANIVLAQGHYRQALRLLTLSLDRLGDQPHLSTKTKWHLVECYLALNRYPEARELAQQVVADNRRFSDAYELARSLMQLATAEGELGNFGEARGALDEADAVFTGLGSGTWGALVALRRGRLDLRLNAAALALAAGRQAGQYFGKHGQKAYEAAAALLMAEAALALGNPAEAAEIGVSVLRSAQRYSVPAMRYAAHLLLGQAAEARAAIGRAKRHYRAAAATTERVQRGLTITLRPGFLEGNGDALRRLIALQLMEGEPRQALEALEQAKAQLHIGYLTNRERLRWNLADAHSRSLLEELEQLRSEHQWLYGLAHENASQTDRRSSLGPAEAWSQLPVYEHRMRAITEQLYYHNHLETDAPPSPTQSLIDVQLALDDETLLIEYYDDGSHLWAFCLSRQDLSIISLNTTMATVSEVMSRLRRNIAAALSTGAQAPGMLQLTRHAELLLQRLHAGLLAPLALRPHTWRRLVIVPYGQLHYLPFGLLFDGAKYLIEHHELVILPAASLATHQGPSQRRGALILANSHGGRLTNTQAEANMVQQVLGGVLYGEEKASRAILRSAPTQVLHIAAHGKFRPDQPDLSYLELADGQIYTDDLLQQDLSYELVTLSACETGRAHAIGGELIGLGRGFLYAGAGALVLSHWPIIDESVLQLMAWLYAALKSGQNKAAALRSTQQALLTENPRLHPAFWGAFQLIGDPRPLTA